MNEQEAMNVILHNGKRSCVYSDEYSRLPKDLGMMRYIDLRNFCKAQGARDIREWLTTKGLYCDVEKDMREGSDAVDWQGSVEAFCAQILEAYPLAGEPVLREEALTRLFNRAQSIFDAVAEYGKTTLSFGERDVMAMAIVQYVKRRNLQEDNKADNQFWPYIYSQFGFKKDNDRTNTQRIYNTLRAAVRGAFLQHNRFFSSEKETQQYYTSIRLHAFTPVQSMESLFEILLFFYINDLEFAYTQEDPIFKALVECIATRWDKDIELQEELNVRSNSMASGLKALFRERPDFMRAFCEQIVKGIDALVRGVDMLNPDSTLNVLLGEWYAKKEDALKNRLSKGKSDGFIGSRAISSAETVRLRYVMDNRKVCLSVPSIRLEHKADTYPVFEMYQGETRIYACEMEVYGRLSWTTRAMLIPLKDTEMDFDCPLNIEVSIRYDGAELLKRDSRLHRDTIVFADNGRETSAQTSAKGTYYLFANDTAHIDTGNIEPEWIDHDGQLMRLYVDEGHAVYVDGAELFLARDRQGEIRYYTTVSRVNGLRGCREGETFNIYPAPFKLDMRLPEGKRSLNYRIRIDDTFDPLSRYCPDDVQSFVFEAPNKPIMQHSVQIVELATGRVVCNVNYAILPNVKCVLDSALIYDDGSPITIHVCYDGCDITSRTYPVEETDWIALSASHLEYDLEAKMPLIRGSLMGQNIFEMPSLIWRGRISDAAFVKVHFPADWSCTLYLGAMEVPQNTTDGSYELGNFIKTYRYRDKADALTLKLRNMRGQQEIRTLSKIAFEEYFTESPVSIEDGSLMWRPEGKYIGGSKDEFQLIIDVQVEGSPFSYALDMKDTVVDRQFGRDFPCGEFPFRITKTRRSLFGAGEDRVLFEGRLAVGEPEQRKVMGKYLYLTKARCWDVNENRMIILEMSSSSGCLCNLQFQGYSIPGGEMLEYPEYVGDLFFYDPSLKDWQYFNSQEQPGYECINPVHVWIISEQMIIMTTVYEDAVMIDRQCGTIINRTLNISREAEKYRIILPDYFEYRTE